VKKTCFNCFSDDAIREYIQRNGINGDCNFCKEENTLVSPTQEIEPLLEAALACLKKDDNGSKITDILDQDLRIFSHRKINKHQLTKEIIPEFNHEETYGFTNKLSIENDWLEYRKEITLNNRFFPSKELSESLFNHSRGSTLESLFIAFLSTLTKKYFELDTFWRSRISNCPLSHTEMGKPPAELASAGRANPPGIAYLYMASNPETAINEVRPHPGSTVYVANCQIGVEKTIKVLDLCQPANKASILKFEEEYIPHVIRILKMLEVFGEELSKPVLPDKSHIEYVPTQYLCEFLKRQTRTLPDGKKEPLFDGIRYKSSLNPDGFNIVLFDDSKINVGNPEKVVITRTNVEFRI
jgi:hypothetical protein